MRLREMSFTSTRQLVEFANYRQLNPEQIQNIIRGAHPNENLKVTLVFWDSETLIPPLMETDPVFEEESDNAILFKPSGLSLPVSSVDKVKANLAYAKIKVALEDSKGTPESILDYLDRKDKERAQRDRIGKAVDSTEENENFITTNEGISTFASKEPSYSDDDDDEDDLTYERKNLWKDVHTLWKIRYPDVDMNVPFRKLQFQGETIFVPMYCFGESSEGAVFYNLSLIVEEIFGKSVVLEYL
jgi:hypothetical protein